MMDEETVDANVAEVRDGKSSGPILNALDKAYTDSDFETWRTVCQSIEDAYSSNAGYTWGNNRNFGELGLGDGFGQELDLFWSSYEVMKPAVYAKPPIPAVAPVFKDNDEVVTTTAELLERVSTVALMQNNIDLVMKQARDDLLFYGRGVIWVTYEDQRVCVDHVDRDDFRHEPARYWESVGWVAKRAWLSRKEMKERFGARIAKLAKYTAKRGDDYSYPNNERLTRKCGVWEVWHKADDRVYWVTEGVPEILDEDKPHLKLKDFFPCPRPAYGTLRLRTLVPIPDWTRYATHFQQINVLTARIYALLEMVKMKGLVPGGGDVANAVESALSAVDDSIIVSVPGAALMQGGGDFVQWMPLDQIAAAIQGLIEARGQLIEDFYQLSGISDIMRGATEANETLGAQQLKSQYGSVRVREKIDELQRIAADVVSITAQIAAEKFTKETLLEMSRMDISTEAQIKDRIAEIQKAAKEELKALAKDAEEMAAVEAEKAQQAIAAGEMDPAQAEQMAAQAQEQYQQAQQQVLQKYAPALQEAEARVPLESVMELLRDDKARCFTFEIESDSTILTDELQEKASRAEFLNTFNTVAASMAQIGTMGEEGAALVGEMLKFALAPYRAGRPMNGAIDKFTDALPGMVAQAGEGDDAGLAAAQMELAKAENTKAQAAVMQAQAKAANDQAQMQLKMADMQQKAQADATKAQQENDKLRLQMADMGVKADQAQRKMEAELDKVRAQTLEILNNIGLANKKQQMDEFRSVADIQMDERGQAFNEEQAATDQQFRDRDMERAERGEERADRQQSFAERTAGSES